MLTLYNYLPVDSVISNDEWFEQNTLNRLVSTDKQAGLISKITEIEGISYEGNLNFKSKFTNSTIFITSISTGMKTLLNILLFPEKVFNAAECGDNILSHIFRLDTASIYLDRCYSDDELLNSNTPIKCNSRVSSESFVARNFLEAMDWNEHWIRYGGVD